MQFENNIYFCGGHFGAHTYKILNSLLKLHILSDKIITLYVNIGRQSYYGSIKSNWKILRSYWTLD